MAAFSSGGMHGPDSFLDKLTTEQLSKILDQTEEANKRSNSIQTQGMWMAFAVFLAALVLIGFLCWLFLSFGKGDLLREIIALLIGLGGGSVGGFGVGRLTAKRPDA